MRLPTSRKSKLFECLICGRRLTTNRISEPEIKAPWAISMAMLFTYLAGWLFNIVLCFCMVRIDPRGVARMSVLTCFQGDPAEILASPIYQPVGQLFYNSLGKSGGIFYTVAAFIILQFVCFTAMVSPKQLSLCPCNYFAPARLPTYMVDFAPAPQRPLAVRPCSISHSLCLTKVLFSLLSHWLNELIPLPLRLTLPHATVHRGFSWTLC